MKNYVSILLVSIVSLACQKDGRPLENLFSLPKSLKEVSGISYANDSKLLWTLEDSGNADKIYGLTAEGKIKYEIEISGAKNRDWEDITKDQAGNIYIGDFGNNNNDRKDLCIYKINKESLSSQQAVPDYKVSFSYPEQHSFPPKKKEMFFDVEGFFEYKGNFYLFTKNRSKGFDGTTFMYKVANRAGTQLAQKVAEFKSCDNFSTCAITSAAISPDQSKVVLLCHDTLWLFDNFKNDAFLSGNVQELDLEHNSQKEAVCFKDNENLLIADEKTKKIGGNVYAVKITDLKSKS
ncbi:SdiA-regulated domain-containing protein [Flavobacterium sp.]|uniref:SdiA-regulated domain-containing protein n=1 Tax=Flavobacterium sp. TaxID=239 RepID=UPI0026037498|nr:SdiA-regulated domain-containing protein [Flavobacterium sp.]MDG2433303.1 SdiA-regulated domain-containing protein [Flavobacterium sp.]